MRWSGLGLSYDELSEEQSAAQQLKYAIQKTLIFKKAQNLKIFQNKVKFDHFTVEILYFNGQIWNLHKILI